EYPMVVHFKGFNQGTFEQRRQVREALEAAIKRLVITKWTLEDNEWWDNIAAKYGNDKKSDLYILVHNREFYLERLRRLINHFKNPDAYLEIEIHRTPEGPGDAFIRKGLMGYVGETIHLNPIVFGIAPPGRTGMTK